ncbi:MAG: PIG-L family deacetylase [Acidobacteriota bacterium]
MPSRRRLLTLVAVLVTLQMPPIRSALAADPLDPLLPASTGGVAEIDHDLAKLVAHQRVLVIGAHPDDEDTSLLAYAARGLGAEAAYLALSRGEGGQNVVGPQLGADLGLIRTQELLAARRVDGARQFFTRAFDFGFTSSLDETLRFWPKQDLLLDTVRILRRFRPQVVVSIFPDDGRGGHGQHQAAGVVAHEAFKMAGDPKAFPELAKEGLLPWKPLALYRSAWFNREEATMVLPLGGIDPFTGKSIGQLAAESRGRHRSQSMGRLQEMGARDTRIAWVSGGAGREGTTLFAGIDTRLQAIAQVLPDGALRGEIATELDLAENAARQARGRLVPQDASAVAPLLREVLLHLRLARERAAGAVKMPTATIAVDLIDEKIAAAERALAAASGLAIDAAAEREKVVRGEPVKVKLMLWNAGTQALQVVSAAVRSADGWMLKQPETAARELAAGASGDWAAEADPTAVSTPTVAYFSRRPLQGFLYDWSAAPPAVRGEPFQPPPLVATFDLVLDGVALHLEREVVYRVGDEVAGEVRRPLRAVPALEVAVDPHLLVVSTVTPQAGTLRVTLSSNSTKPLTGSVKADVSAGWTAPVPVAFALAPGEQQNVTLTLAPPAKLAPGKTKVQVEATTATESFASAVPVIDLPHIPPTPRPQPSEAAVVATDLRLPQLAHIGYVRGASDVVPEALAKIGLPIELLTGTDLRSADLTRYDAIVVGSRAYETEPALAAANARLLDYVRGGGLMLVQYQQYAYSDGNFAPFPLQIARPHDRVTDETSPVVVLDAAHPVMTTPNLINAADWDGWIQERGLYFAHTFDPAWKPLLELADKGQSPQRGGLLIGKVGQGTYVYTGIAFFRELPAGVPGAYRLFANLLALGERPAMAR